MIPWFEDDDFWESLEQFFFACIRTDTGTVGEVDQIIALTRPAAGGVVLDLCCGRGRHSLEFARRGFHITGVDRTEKYLDAARSLAAQQHLSIELVKQDMRKFRRENCYDLALNLFTSFGYFDDPDDEQRVLRNLYDSLRPGGKLVMEMMGKEVLARTFQPRFWYYHPEGSAYLLQECVVRDGWEWIDNQWILLKGSCQKAFNFHTRIYSGVELGEALRSVGFRQVDLYGGLDGCEYDHNAKRLVAVATRDS